MNNWMLCKVKYTKHQENGTLKRVAEPYLLAAMTFTDAEARIYEELGPLIKGEFHVISIVRHELHDIFAYDDADTWYKVKMKYESVDSENGRMVSQTFLVNASSTKEADDRVRENISNFYHSFEITSVVKTTIVDIFPYSENLDKELSREPAMEGVE